MHLSHQNSKARIVARMKKSSGRSGDKTPLRRLERRDAAKHINYDPDSSSSSLSKHLSFSTYSRWLTRRVTVKQTKDDAVSSFSSVSTDSFMTPSMEFPDRTSFRNLGGEDRIYKSIGVSGPEDLAISFDAWEASKKRSPSDVINGSKSSELDHHKFPVRDVSEANTELTLYESRNGGLKGTPKITRGYLVPNPSDVAVVVGGGRPARLKPPPAKRPPIDHQGSSWDFLTHFAPKGEIVRRPSSSSSSDNGEEACEEEVERVLENEMIFSSDSSRTESDTSPPIYSNGGSMITSWQKGELLGRGSSASVYEGISGDGAFFAVKEVSLLEQGSQAQECIKQLEGEVALLSQLQHQNIVRYRGTAKDGSNLYIFLELVSQGSLLKLYQRYQLMDSVVSLYTRQILDGLKYLHDKGFIHRDIKCANILVDASGAVKLADFGLAKVSKLNDIKSCKGTPFWMAPEVVNPKLSDGIGSSADIWSIGCTVLEMLTGQIPYWGRENPVEAFFRVGRGVLPDIPDTLSLDAQDFIIRCLKVNPEERPTAAELLNHPFVRRRPLSSSGSGLASLLINKVKACEVQTV